MRSTVAAGVFTLAVCLIGGGLAGGPVAAAQASVAAAPGYTAGIPQLATITNGTSAAPWDEWQGDSSAASDVSLPTFAAGQADATTGYPNVAVASGSAANANYPYASGIAGSPGTLAGYCASTDTTSANPAGTAATSVGSTSTTVNRQPDGSTLPLAPSYFPRVVKNADGSLTGYFDYRPKDQDEAVLVGTSTDGGKSWTYDSEHLEQNPVYCATGDVNDDGQGHSFVTTIGGTTRLYTLQRAAGDTVGVGLITHTITPTAADPLNGAPAVEKVGIDPNSFATASVSVPTSGTATIPVQSTGTAHSTEQLIAGGFVDLTATPTPTAADVITCTGTDATDLTGCSYAGTDALTVNPGDLVEQVIGYVAGSGAKPKSVTATPFTIPSGPNNLGGTGGVQAIGVVATKGAAYANATSTFTNPLTGTWFNNNAPNRAYIDGVAIYCVQANANPTSAIEDCTTGPGAAALAVAPGDPITSDPIIPASADAVTTGLVAPDGIVDVLPSCPGAPAGATTVMYTEKELNYFVAGTTTNAAAVTFGSAPFTLTFAPGQYVGQDLPGNISTASPVTVSMGDLTSGGFVQVTCTGLTPGATYALTGCTVPASAASDQYDATSQIAAPGATVETPAALGLTGEGSSKAAKLFKNNEDLVLTRAAYTTDGVNFSVAGLANGGMISDCVTGSADGTVSINTVNCNPGAHYQGLTNPVSTTDPAQGLNYYADNGLADATEMRWNGAAGTIITNADGSYTLFNSAAWSADGDSDAYNQIYYATSSDGEHWSVPKPVVSTDYTFAAAAAFDASGNTAPLGIGAYYSGRAYGPSVVQNADGSLTLVFAGYQVPKAMPSADSTIGTGATQWTTADGHPAAYRNILVETLEPAATPTIVGKARVGSTLTADAGTWAPGVTPSYQWLSGGAPITGATDSSYTPVAADAGALISVRVTGSQPNGVSQSETSAAVGPVVAPVTATVTGTAKVGNTLAAVAAGGAPGSVYAYQWSGNGVALAGATGSTLPLTGALYGENIAVKVTASASGYTDMSATSAVVGPVTAGTGKTGTVTVAGTAKVGQKLTATASGWQAGAALKYQWQANGASVSGATGSSLTLTAALLNKHVTVVVSATQTGYTFASVTSKAVTVAAGTLTAATPTITGTAANGKTLTAHAGTWKPSGVAFHYQWYANGRAISGATHSTLKLGKAQVGKRIGVRVTGTLTGYTAVVKTSKATAVVHK